MSPNRQPLSIKSLEQITTVRGGYSPRRLDIDPVGGYRGLQARDFQASGEVVWARLIRPRVPDDAERYEVHDGDLVLLLRGAAVRVWSIVRPPERVIMLGHFAIVTPRPGVADSAYLFWYFQQPATLARLQQVSKGSSLAFVPMSEFRCLEIALPPLDVQQRIGRIHALAGSERALTQRLDALRRQHLDLQLLCAAEAYRSPGGK